MTPAKIFTGARFDIQAFKGQYEIIDFPFEVLNDDCTPRDMDDSSGVFFKLFAKQNGKALLELEMEFDASASPDGFIYLSDGGQILALRHPRIYWYEVYSIEGSPEQPVLLFFGTLEL
jgi:hypothetical protein